MIRTKHMVPDRQPASIAASSADTVPALFVGSFPPRECGIATFTEDLVNGYDAATASRSDVVAIDDRPGSDVYMERMVRCA